MVRSDGAVSSRRYRRFIVHILPLSVIAVCGVGIFLFVRSLFSPIAFRQTVVIVADPIHVVSFDAKNRKITTVDIPLDTVIPAALGYGKYSVKALISLDDIDHHNGVLISGSISNALGLPISGLIKSRTNVDGAMNLDRLRKIFSFGSIPSVLIAKNQSVSWELWGRLVMSVASMNVDAWHPINISQAIIDTVSADGSSVLSLDESRVDYIIDTAFFDSGIRSEGVSVAVYNTTDVSSVGLRASRQLSRVGMQLIYVGNKDLDVTRCVVAGADSMKHTKTVLFIRDYYDCDIKQDESIGKDTGADIVVLLGEDFAKRYR